MKELFDFEFEKKRIIKSNDKKEILKSLLDEDFNYHRKKSGNGIHGLHAFPAKFPPQLPEIFIEYLTEPGQTVLDPMMGSGTTILEAIGKNRNSIGCDLDPLSILIVKVKTQSYNKRELIECGNRVLQDSYHLFHDKKDEIENIYDSKFSDKSKKFIEYWFAPQTIYELTSLLYSIEQINNEKIRNFLKVVFSSTIITKTGGVSLALDLAHTRPHKAKKVLNSNNKLLYENNLDRYTEKRQKILTKKIRSAFELFKHNLKENVYAVFDQLPGNAVIQHADSQNLPISNEKVNLIVTSPPYASTAIDYMRAHKFSLIWLGFEMDDLSKIRGEYIGGESVSGFSFSELPAQVQKKIIELQKIDSKKSRALHRYFTEMSKVLSEMYRVLENNSVAIVVVGNSNLKGINTELQKCLPEIGNEVGFEVPAIWMRNLDRNKRMMPVGTKINNLSQIEKRMHIEYVISFYKQ
ncbi:MAG: DNA methyltransferase [Bacteroidales bacterium]